MHHQHRYYPTLPIYLLPLLSIERPAGTNPMDTQSYFTTYLVTSANYRQSTHQSNSHVLSTKKIPMQPRMRIAGKCNPASSPSISRSTWNQTQCPSGTAPLNHQWCSAENSDSAIVRLCRQIYRKIIYQILDGLTVMISACQSLAGTSAGDLGSTPSRGDLFCSFFCSSIWSLLFGERVGVRTCGGGGGW